MTDLVAFLLARLAEDEQLAHAAGGEEWVGLDVDGFVRARTPDGAFISGVVWTDEVAHIVRHDPARVLADIVAKRAIVALHEGGDHECREMHVGVYSDDWPQATPWGAAGQPWRHACSEYVEGDCETLKLLALPFADHPDYNKAWKV